MGKASKWFRSLWSSKKSPESSPAKENNKKSRLSLSSSGGNSGKLKNHFEDPLANTYVEGIDAKMHAIAVAAATAAEAALAAAQAATEVVRLTEGGRSWRVALDASYDRQLVSAAVKIQSAFRAYLARRALRALKGLVKLQALVRGYIVRKQSADMLRCMQVMARIQARASAHRSYYMPESPYAKTNLSNSHNPSNHSRSRTGISVYEETSHISSQWLNHWMEQCALEKTHHDTYLENDKILEIDTWRPHLDNKTRNGRSTPTSRFFSAWKETGADYTTKTGLPSELHKPNPSISSEDVLSVGDHVPALTAHNSTCVHSASCRPTGSLRGPSFTPSRSECSRSLLGDYLGHPSYMANTESSRAKVRCRSVPKQRMQLEEIGLSHDFWDYSDAIPGRCSFLAANNTGGTYRYSGQVKRQWTPHTRDAGVIRLRP